MDAKGTDAWKWKAADWLSGIVFLAVGVANLLVVHFVPALAYGLVSLVYLPPARAVVKRRLGIAVILSPGSPWRLPRRCSRWA